MNDVLGVCQAWGPEAAVIAREGGSTVTVPIADIVSGKPVPPRPSVRLRMSPLEAQQRSLVMWPHVDTEQLGDWVLRSSESDPVRRANSALAMGDPGISFTRAVQRVLDYYRDRDKRPLVMVEADSEVCKRFTDAGWELDRPHEPDTWFQVASISRARRAVSGIRTIEVEMVADDHRLEARVGDEALIRAAYDRDWLGLHALNVEPSRRRQGLALNLLSAMLDWGAERGATTAYLQVLADNESALELYERLGFSTHHAYRYLTPG
nr:GNAT family N-acetyltransferase [Nocardioides sp. DJM-14]